MRLITSTNPTDMSIDLNKTKPQAPKPEVEGEKSGLAAIWAFMNRDFQLGGSSFGIKKKVSFYEELDILLNAGLDIRSALELLIGNLRKKKDKALIEQLKQKVVEGSTLSEALRTLGPFSEYEVFSIQIGEEAGKLNEVLRELASFFQKTLKYQRQLMGALSYPLFVLSFSMLALWFLLRYLVPMFSGIYSRFGNELPYLTKVVVNLSDGMRLYGPWAMGIGLLSAGFIYTQRQQTWWRKLSARLLVGLPIFGPIVHRLFLARFCQSMALLLGAKVPLLQAVALVHRMIRFYPIEQALEQTRQDVMHGQSLHKSLSDFPFFPPSLIALTRVGEESGQLDMMFERLASTYNMEVDQRTQVIGSLIEPILIIFLGVIVSVILVAMYLPLFQLSTNMGM